MEWDDIIQAIPEEWLYRDPDSFLKHLQRFRSENFWNWK